MADKHWLPILKSAETITLVGFTPEQAERVRNILKKVPEAIVNRTFNKITLDESLDNDEKYKSYGRYNKETRELRINPRAFKVVDTFTDGQNEMSKLEHMILHELGHGVDVMYGVSGDPEWLKLSGWSNSPDNAKKKLVIPQEEGKNIESGWYYDDKADFTRWYGKRNPKDDWSECFAFYVGKLHNRFKDMNKFNYVKGKLNGIGVK